MVDIKNVSFSYKNGNNTSLKDINFKVNKGSLVLLCGKSGCGKTTITRLLNGLIPNYYEGNLQGEMFIKEKKINKIPMYEISQLVSSVFQNPRTQFFNVDTTSELVFNLENQGIEETKILEKLEMVVNKYNIKYLLDRNIFHLSGGEKQIVACACASLNNSDIVILDEPSSNLDVAAIRKLKQMIKIWKEEGKTIIVAEHRLYYLKGLIDKVFYLKDGKIEKYLNEKELLNFSLEESKEMGIRRMDFEELKKLDLFSFNKEQKVIEFNNYLFSYLYKSKEYAINIPNLIVPSNEIIAIIGPNGSGKSTFIKCISGLESSCMGRYLFEKKVYSKKDKLKNTFIVMQDVNHQLFTESVDEELRISNMKSNEKEIENILEKMSFLDKKSKHPMSLSGGEKQRLAISTALISNRKILIFDEPTSGLDLEHMKKVALRFKELKEQNKSIFVVTHDYELIMKCCTYIIYLEKGKVKDNFFLDKNGKKKLIEYFQI